MLKNQLLGRAVAYYRVSSDEQRQGQTVRGQQTFVGNWCRSRELPLREEFVDEDDNGEREFWDRQGGGALWRAAQREEFDTVVVFAVDRTGRTLYACSHFFEQLRRLGIRVVSATQEFDPDEATGPLLLGLLAAQSQVDKRTIRTRTEAGKATWQAVPNTYTGGQIPFGYTTERRGKRQYYVLCQLPIPGGDCSPEEVILRLFTRYRDGASLDRIAAEMSGLGITTCWVPGDPRYHVPSQSRWSAQRVHEILTNPFYKGEQWIGHPSKGAVCKGKPRCRREEPLCHPVPVLVAPELWEAVNRRLKSTGRGDRASEQFYLLRGKIRCLACGRPYTGASSLGGFMPRGRYYRCLSQTQGGGCKGRWVDAEDLEQPIKSDILWILGHSERFVGQIQEQIGSEENRAAALLDEAAKLDRARAKLAETEMEYLRMFAAGLISSEEKLRLLLSELQARDQSLRQDADALRQQALASAEVDQRLRATQAVLAAYHDRAEAGYSPTEWRELVRLLVDRVEIETRVELPPAPRRRGQCRRAVPIAHPYYRVDLLAIQSAATSGWLRYCERIVPCLYGPELRALLTPAAPR